MENCKIYSRFTKTLKDGSVVKLRIQDMPQSSFQDVFDLQMAYFVREEQVHKSSGVYKSEDAVAEYVEIFTALTQVLDLHVVICCIDDNTENVGRLVGSSAMHLSTGKMDLNQFQVETKEMKKLFELAMQVFYSYDVVKEHKVEKFYDDISIIVHPDFRRLGISKQFVALRRRICKENDVPLASAWMTAWGTQKAGAEDKWEQVDECFYEDLSNRFGVTFDDDAPPSAKLMIARKN